MADEPQSGPRVVLAFQNYVPPFDAEKVVRRMLRIVPSNYLWGLHSIVLTNVAALSRKERDRRTRGRDKRTTLGEALGYYSPAWTGGPAKITLLLDNFEKRWGRSWLRFSFIRDGLLSELLFHEVGHHIHHLHLPEHEGKENVAEKWSKRLRGKYLRDRHWYLWPIAVPFALIDGLVRDIARLYRRFRAKL